MMDLYGEELDNPGGGDHALYEQMLEALSAGAWQGDRDDWQQPISDANWRPVTVDNAQCMGPKCSHFRNCCFYQARDTMDQADVIVSNHDLVLADLALGGGVILPAPEECLYIFDEAHHLPFKSNSHFASFTRIRASSGWLERTEALLPRLVTDNLLATSQHDLLLSLVRATRERLNEAWLLLEQTLAEIESVDRYENRAQHAFKLGVVPPELQDLAGTLANQFTRLATGFQGITDELKEALEDGADGARSALAEQWFPLLGSMCKRAEGSQALWLSYSVTDPVGAAPFARWLSMNEGGNYPDIALSSSPVLAADNLQQRLWQSCAGAVLTSATLSALGEFAMLKLRAGLPPHTRYLSIPSPFNFAEAGVLTIPRMNCDPSQTEQHTDFIVTAIPRLLAADCAALPLVAVVWPGTVSCPGPPAFVSPSP
jgi:ATP-dependent DNA helicase DinG